MKIAVPFSNGEVFQHFGHTETFKLYEIVDGRVASIDIVDTNGSGHEALAGLLADLSVNVLVCGGIGEGAQEALTAAGIEICSGAQGDADNAVNAYLRGELQSAGVNCDHHHDHEDGEGCGSHCGGGCSAPLQFRALPACLVHRTRQAPLPLKGEPSFCRNKNLCKTKT